MSAAWLTIAGLAAVAVALRVGSALLAGGREPSARALAVIEALAPSLLAALIVVETLGSSDGGVALDARAGGLLGAAAVVALRGPLIAAVTVAAVAAALIRLLG